jgi:predicted molibdopterin-dependent oxidoreductase YjgC
MLRASGVRRVAMAVRRGYSDDFLIKPEKAANARGARELGLVSGEDDGLSDLLRAAESGELKGLYICGGDLFEVAAAERLDAIFERLELLIVHTLKLDQRLGRAAVVFPVTTFAEKNGSFTNFSGRVQRIFKALDTPPGWFSDGEIFTRLLSAADGQARSFDPESVWQAIGRAYPRFAALSLEELGAGGGMLEDIPAQNAGER